MIRRVFQMDLAVAIFQVEAREVIGQTIQVPTIRGALSIPVVAIHFLAAIDMTTTKKLIIAAIIIAILALAFYIAYRKGASDANIENAIKSDKAKIEVNKAKSDTITADIHKSTDSLRKSGTEAVNRKNKLKYEKHNIARDTAYDNQWREVFGTEPSN